MLSSRAVCLKAEQSANWRKAENSLAFPFPDVLSVNVYEGLGEPFFKDIEGIHLFWALFFEKNPAFSLGGHVQIVDIAKKTAPILCKNNKLSKTQF